DPAHVVHRGDRAVMGTGAAAAAVARRHWPLRATAVDGHPARRPLPDPAGVAAWRGDLDLAHTDTLCAGAGQPVVARRRARLLPLQRLAVLVVGAARQSEAGAA